MKQTALLIPEVFDMIRKQGDNAETKIKQLDFDSVNAKINIEKILKHVYNR